MNTAIFIPSSVLNNANIEKEVSAISHISFLLFGGFLSAQLSRYMLVNQKRFTSIFDLGDGAFKVEGF